MVWKMPVLVWKRTRTLSSKVESMHFLCVLWICFLHFFQTMNFDLKDEINEKWTELDTWQCGRCTINILPLSVRWGRLQRAVAAVWARVLPIWGRNAHGALISDRSSPPLLLMACGSFLLLLLLLCAQSIDWRRWPAPTARCRGREVIGVVCVWVCVSASDTSSGLVHAVMFE